MSIKSFITKKALQMKGVPKEQAEKIAKELEENPQLAESLKALEANPEVKALFEKIQKEVEEKQKAGLADMYAMTLVMGKYKNEIAKYRKELEPLMTLFSK